MSSSFLSMKIVAIVCVAFVLGFPGNGVIIVTESFQTMQTASSKELLSVGSGGRGLCLKRLSSQSPTTIIMRRDKVNINNSRNTNQRNDPSLYLFGRNKDENSNNENGNDDIDTEKKKSSIPFFGRLKKRTLKNSDEQQQQQQQQQQQADVILPLDTVTVTPTATASTTTTATPPKEKIMKKELPTPDDLLAMAKRARLESEKLDAELTLSKIEKLEKKLMKTTKAESSEFSPKSSANNSVEDLQYQLDVLQAKLRGEPAPVKVVTTQAQASSSSTTTATGRDITNPTVRDLFVNEDIDDSKVIEAANKLAATENDNYEFTTEKDIEKIPNFLLKILAAFVGMDISNNIDKKEFLKRWEMTQNLDYSSITNKTAPVFTSMDIQRKKRAILDSGNTTTSNIFEQTEDGEDMLLIVTKNMIKKADGNATQLALYGLENDYYLEMGGNMLSSVPLEDITPDFVKGLLNESFFEQMYPKCVTSRGEGENDDYVSEEPTMANIDVLTKTILPAIKYSSSSKPLKVAGGYAITGSHKFDNGDALIEAIDKEISKSRPNLMDQITVLYTQSYGPLNNFSLGGESIDSLANMDSLLTQDTLELFAESEPILYITGPDIVRKSNRLGLTLTSIIGLATSWYLAVYPYLLNDQVASKVDADLKLLEANLQPDMSYLTDLSVPLFLSFIGLQLVHEAGHRLVAISKGVKLSVPVFVPSFITGITSTVTTFKTLPKNKNDMFDISAAGPLAGIVASSIALAIGTKLTIISDPSTLPALPLDILRQSTLGGAIIDNLITGLLYIPEGASSAGINIPLHPLAIAGYTSLLVNALALLPIGTSDGGRLTMALFDRAEKMSIGTLTLAVLLYAGLFGSDMFLFYFSFCLAFQTGNEVPARNEQDSVDFSRVIVAIVCYGLAILTLVPIQ